MKERFELRKTLLRRGARIFNRLIHCFASDQDSVLTQAEVEHRFEQVLQCGF